MEITRRSFVKISGTAAAGIALGGLGFDLAPIKAHAQALRIRWAKETTTICPYCAVGCGIIVYTARDGSGRIINTEGEQPARLQILWGVSPLPSVTRFGRLAYPMHGKVTTRVLLGRKSHGCHMALGA
jgi:anaerobic selenocysteine-containing dehydrogenase